MRCDLLGAGSTRLAVGHGALFNSVPSTCNSGDDFHFGLNYTLGCNALVGADAIHNWLVVTTSSRSPFVGSYVHSRA